MVKWVGEKVYVRAYELITREADLGMRVRFPGFRGWCEYRVVEGGGYSAWVPALSRFATFFNVGAKRTAGFGVTAYKPLSSFSPV